MEKNKEIYTNYVCPYCWNTLDNCICDLFPPYHLIFIDRNIQKHIRILNNKGYHTVYCCEGHKEGCINTYITFSKEYFKDINTPKGFKYNKKEKTITYTYSPQLAEEKMEKLKKEKLSILLEWIKGLPSKNIEI